MWLARLLILDYQMNKKSITLLIKKVSFIILEAFNLISKDKDKDKYLWYVRW